MDPIIVAPVVTPAAGVIPGAVQSVAELAMANPYVTAGVAGVTVGLAAWKGTELGIPAAKTGFGYLRGALTGARHKVAEWCADKPHVAAAEKVAQPQAAAA